MRPATADRDYRFLDLTGRGRDAAFLRAGAALALAFRAAVTGFGRA
jgi:hypothetical protein